MTKTASLAHITLAYVVAIAVGAAWLLLGPETGRFWLDTLIADVLATCVIFGFSRAYGNSSFYDAYWSVIPPLLVLAWWIESDLGAGDVRAWLAMVVVVLWAVRLTANWVYAFPGMHHEDWRYPMVRERAGSFAVVADFLGIHLFPTLQVFLASVPVYVVVNRGGTPIGWLDVVALGVGVGAVTLQLVSDVQMHRFVRVREPGQAMDRGLWAWSRHPNYFGEISFWVSLALFGIAASPGDWWWIPLGAIAMIVMFLFVSIPWMEQRSLERRPAYADVVDRVPLLVPRPPRRRDSARSPSA